MISSSRIGRLEAKSAREISFLAEEERRRIAEETRETRNQEAASRQWSMLLHYIEGDSGPGSDEAKAMLKRILRHVKEYSDDLDISMMCPEEKAFWHMLIAVFDCIDTEWLVSYEIDYQLDEILGEEAAQKFRVDTTMDERIAFLDEHLGPSWRAIQYEYASCEGLKWEPEALERFLRGQEAIKEVADGKYQSKIDEYEQD